MELIYNDGLQYLYMPTTKRQENKNISLRKIISFELKRFKVKITTNKEPIKIGLFVFSLLFIFIFLVQFHLYWYEGDFQIFYS